MLTNAPVLPLLSFNTLKLIVVTTRDVSQITLTIQHRRTYVRNDNERTYLLHFLRFTPFYKYKQAEHQTVSRSPVAQNYLSTNV